ncbi:MAG: BCCT family transporter, partial [Anaerovoracaceae bacterium]
MMGIFIAKVSKGRTIRQVSFATLFGISAGGWLIFAIDGSFSIHAHINGLTDLVSQVGAGHGETGIYNTLELLPGGAMILPIIMMVIIVGFVASSLDTASLSLAQTTTKTLEKGGDVSRWLRVFWCIVLTLVPLSIIFAKADFSALKMLSCIISVPFMFIIIYMEFGLFKWFKEDKKSGLLQKYMMKDS